MPLKIIIERYHERKNQSRGYRQDWQTRWQKRIKFQLCCAMSSYYRLTLSSSCSSSKTLLCNVWEPDRMIDGRLIGISWVGSSKAAAAAQQWKEYQISCHQQDCAPSRGRVEMGLQTDWWWLWDCWERLVFGVFDGLIEGILRSVCHSVSLWNVKSVCCARTISSLGTDLPTEGCFFVC